MLLHPSAQPLSLLCIFPCPTFPDLPLAAPRLRCCLLLCQRRLQGDLQWLCILLEAAAGNSEFLFCNSGGRLLLPRSTSTGIYFQGGECKLLRECGWRWSLRCKSVLVRSGDCEALLLPSICQRLSKVLAVTSPSFLIQAWQRNTVRGCQSIILF